MWKSRNGHLYQKLLIDEVRSLESLGGGPISKGQILEHEILERVKISDVRALVNQSSSYQRLEHINPQY